MSHLNGAPLGHNPQADEAERLRVRETFNLKEHFGGAVPQPKEQQAPIVITKAQVMELARGYGLDLIVQGPSQAGRIGNIEEKYEALKLDHAALASRAQRLNAENNDRAALIEKLIARNSELAAEVLSLKETKESPNA